MERRTRLYRNMRLRDHLRHRGVKAKKDNDKPPKKYPLEGTDWSSCDETDDEDVGMWDAAPTAFGFAPGDGARQPMNV